MDKAAIFVQLKNNMSQNIEEKKFFSTLREDNWWLSPLLVLLGLLSFILYSAWAAWQGEYFWWSGAINAEGFGGYLSPF